MLRRMSPYRKASLMWFVVIVAATVIAGALGASTTVLGMFGVVLVVGHMALYMLSK
jgi:hypothetical protein